MECPNCGMIHFDSVEWCNCGYHFKHRFFLTLSGGFKGIIDLCYGFFGFPLKCLNCGKHYSHKTKNCSCGFIPTEFRLKRLINLSKNMATEDISIDVDDAKSIIQKCVEITGSASTYSTRQIMWDLSSESRNWLMQRRCDFVAPDRYHSSRHIRDINMDFYEERVSIGNQHYKMVPVWILSGDPEEMSGFHEDNRALSVDNFLTVLRIDKYISSYSFKYMESQYLVLKYKNTSLDLLGTEIEVKELRIWISLDTYLLAKTELIYQHQTPKGDEMHAEIQHAFSAYNEEIEVVPPKNFHQLNDDGSFVMQHTKIDILPHHP